MAVAAAEQMARLQAEIQNLQAQLQTRLPRHKRFVTRENGAKMVRHGQGSPLARIF
jgi:heme oxygenase